MYGSRKGKVNEDKLQVGKEGINKENNDVTNINRGGKHTPQRSENFIFIAQNI